MRERMSRPSSSRPSPWLHDGPASEPSSCCFSGSRGATQGPKTAMRRKNSTRPRPATAARLRAKRRQAAAPGLVLDAGVGISVQDVSRQVHEHGHEGHQQDRALDHRKVPHADRFDDEPADAGKGEYRLHEHGPREDEPELERHHCDDGQERVAERVARDDQAFLDALGARGPDVVLVEHVDHARPRHPRHDAQGRGAEGDRGQDEMGHAPAAARGEQAQHDGEDDDEHDAEIERRCRDTHHRHYHGGVIEGRVPPGRRYDAGQESHDHREERAQHGEQRRVPQTRHDLVQYRALRFQRSSEFTPEDVTEVAHELEVERLVEPELLTDGRKLFRPRVGSGHESRGIAGDDAHGDEYGREDPEQHGEQEQQATADQAAQGRYLLIEASFTTAPPNGITYTFCSSFLKAPMNLGATRKSQGASSMICFWATLYASIRLALSVVWRPAASALSTTSLL